jgi:hypothetical protein
MLVRPHGTQVATTDFQEQDVPIRSCRGGTSTTLNQIHLRSFFAQTNAIFEIEATPLPRSCLTRSPTVLKVRPS